MGHSEHAAANRAANRKAANRKAIVTGATSGIGAAVTRRLVEDGARVVANGRQVSSFNPIYGAAKFALHSVVEALQQEICQHGVRVTLIEPGFVKSEFQAVAGYDPDWFRALEAEQGPFLDPADVAAAIGFVVGQPPHVHLDDIRIRPTRQKV